MYKCPACGKKIELPDDPETNTQMEAGGLIRLTCACGQEYRLDIIVGLDEGTTYNEEDEPVLGYYVCSWNYTGTDPKGLVRNFTL
jgi:hypothetical protein